MSHTRSGRQPILASAAAVLWALRPSARNLPEMLSYPPAPIGANGLTAEERQQYYHLTEGGELYPMAWLLALETEVTDPDGSIRLRPFLEDIERYMGRVVSLAEAIGMLS